MNDKLIATVKQASENWRSAFNSGSASGAASHYEENALMVAKPFGEFKGRKTIEEFWQNIINDGFADVNYINPQIEVVDKKSVILSAGWTMNKAKGIITKELWVAQPDGKVLLREDYFEVQD